MDEMRVRVKFCGMTRREDLEAATELGADAVGLVFVPGTPRALDEARARELLRDVPPFLPRIGVFADAPPAEVRRLREVLGLTAIQLHGHESPADCSAVGRPVVKTFRVGTDWDPSDLDAYDCDACLLEAPVPGRPGGGGVAFDWRRIRGGLGGRRLIVAGGLTPENVEQAIRIVRPYAVDVSSGIESQPGRKEPEKMRRFLDAVRRAGE